MSIQKKLLYQLVDKLPISDRKTAYDFLKYLIDRKGKYILIEADNDPLSPDDLSDLEIAQRQIENGEVVDWEDIKRDYNL